MAFGFPPKYIHDEPLDTFTPQQFLVLIHEGAKQLNWEIGDISKTGFIAYTKFSMSSWSEKVRVEIDSYMASIKSECTGNQIADWGKNQKNINNLLAAFDELKASLTTEELTQKYEDLNALMPAEQDDVSVPPSKSNGIFSIFIPTGGYFVTPILINLNIAIFILMVISGVNFMLPDNESLINWGANFKLVTLDGQWWRLITNCFLHIGILHLLMNMYALLYIGMLLEPYLGKARFTAAYLLTGIAASVVSLWWHDLTISAGASGAIFGMYGVFLALLTTNLIDKSTRKALLTSIAIFVGYNLINGLKEGIDNAAHIGGLISGLFIGYALIPSLKKPNEQKLQLASISLLAVLILATSFVVYKKMPNDIGTYDAKIQEFATSEKMALEVYNLPQGTPDDEILHELKDRGIYYWKQNIDLIDGFKKLDLPVEIREKNTLLRTYCELRIKSYELAYKAISEHSEQYKEQIESYNNQIETLVNKLGGQ